MGIFLSLNEPPCTHISHTIKYFTKQGLQAGRDDTKAKADIKGIEMTCGKNSKQRHAGATIRTFVIFNSHVICQIRIFSKLCFTLTTLKKNYFFDLILFQMCCYCFDIIEYHFTINTRVLTFTKCD